MSMGTEVASAYVRVLPSFKGLDRELHKAFDDALGKISGSSTSKIGKSLGQQIQSSVGPNLSNAINNALGKLGPAASSSLAKAGSSLGAPLRNAVAGASKNFGSAIAESGSQAAKALGTVTSKAFSTGVNSGVTVARNIVGVMGDAANAFRKGMMSAVTSVSSKLTSSVSAGLSNAIKTSMNAAVGVIGAGSAAVASQVAVGGFNTAISANEASAKLQALGYQGEKLKAVMDSVSTAVQGTAYSTAEMSSASVMLLSSGVKAGSQLQGALKNISKLTDMAPDRSFADIGLMYGKAAAAGLVYAEDLNQIAEAGIPIYQQLGKAYGKSITEVKKQAAEGKVTFKDLDAAITELAWDSELFSKLDLKSAFKNLRSAVSKIGAKFWEPLISGLVPFVNDAKSVVNAILKTFDFSPAQKSITAFTSDLTKVFDKFRGADGAIDPNKVRAKLDTIIADFKGFLSKMQGLEGPIIGAVLGISGGMLSGLPIIGPLFAGMSGPVGAFVGLIAGAAATSESLRNELKRLANMITGGVKKAFGGLSGSFSMKTFGDNIAVGLAFIESTFTNIWERISGKVNKGGLGKIAAGIKNGMNGIFAPFKNSNGSVNHKAIDRFIDKVAVGMVKAFNSLKSVITSITTPLRSTLATLSGIFPSMNDGMSAFDSGAITSKLTTVSDAFYSFKERMGAFTGPIIGAVVGMSSGMLSNIPIVGKLFAGVNVPMGAFIGFAAQAATESSSLVTEVKRLAGVIKDSLFSAFKSVGNGLSMKTLGDNIAVGLAFITEMLTRGFEKIGSNGILASIGNFGSNVIKGFNDFFAKFKNGSGAVDHTAISTFIDGIQSQLNDRFGGFISFVDKWKGPIAGALVGLFSGALSKIPVIGPIFGAVTPMIGLFAGGLIQAYSESEVLRESIGRLGEFAKDVGGKIASVFSGASGFDMKSIGDAIGNGLNSIMGFVSSVIDGIRARTPEIQEAVAGFGEAIGGLFSDNADFSPEKLGENIGKAITMVINLAAGAVRIIDGIGTFVMSDAVQGFLGAIFDIAGSIVNNEALLTTFVAIAGGLFLGGKISGIISAITGIFGAGGGAAGAAGAAAGGTSLAGIGSTALIITGAILAIAGIGKLIKELGLNEGLAEALETVRIIVVKAFELGREVIGIVINGVMDYAKSISEKFAEISTIITDAIVSVVDKIVPAIERFNPAFKGLTDMLAQNGANAGTGALAAAGGIAALGVALAGLTNAGNYESVSQAGKGIVNGLWKAGNSAVGNKDAKNLIDPASSLDIMRQSIEVINGVADAARDLEGRWGVALENAINFGSDLPRKISEGIERTSRTVRGSIDHMVDNAMRDTQMRLDSNPLTVRVEVDTSGLNQLSTYQGFSAGGTTINNSNTINNNVNSFDGLNWLTRFGRIGG